jgi:23S rRNA pseudouridine1911/1915/1917 synthase
MDTLLQNLVKSYPNAKRQTLRQMIEHGRVFINGAVAKSLKHPVAPADKVEVKAKSHRPASGLEPLNLIYEDADLLVIDKPAGLLTSTTAKEKRPTAIAIIQEYLSPYKSPPGVVHRLDRDASGLLVFSKTSAAYTGLKSQLAERSMSRVYRAVVKGVPKKPKDLIKTLLVEHADGTIHVTDNEHKGHQAVTEYDLLEKKGKQHAMLRVTLHTGRKNQIRVHLAHIGNPILGDRVYNPEPAASRLMLCAAELCFNHPRTGKFLEFSIPLPPEFSTLYPPKESK